MEVDYNPSLEIDPSKFVLVIGPNFTTAVLNEATNRTEEIELALTSRRLVTLGIQVLLETENFQSDAEREKIDTLYRNAYELDPLFAVRKLSSSLQKGGKYGEWLKRAFEVDLRVLSNESPSLQKVKQLQQEGALVVYTYYDDVLCRISKTKPILPNDFANFEKWSRGEDKGILHINGIYWDPHTVIFDCEAHHAPNHPLNLTAARLSEMFQKRHMVMLGFDVEKHNEDPLLSKFTERYVTEVPLSLHTFHLTRAENPADLNCLHNVVVDTSNKANESPDSYLHSLSNSSLTLWRQIEFPHTDSSEYLMLGLLVIGKEGAKDVSKMMIDSPGVNFALVSSVVYDGHIIHSVSVRVEITKQKDMWQWLTGQQREQLLSKGLLAVVMHSGTILWMRGKPETDSKDLLMSNKLAKAFPAQHSPATSPDIDSLKSYPFFKPKEESLGPLDFNFPKNGARRVPRYTMHQVRARYNQPYTTGTGKSRRSDVSAFGQHTSRALHERRASLPVNSLHTPTNSSHALAQLAHNLQAVGPANGHDLPSYAAIKQALLCDWYKRRPSIQSDPKTLKFLLKSKLISEPLDLLKLRRYSDPGSYISQPESFARRKELFIDENRTWSNTYGKIIEKKIARWQALRLERRRQEIVAWQNGEFPAQGLKYHLLNPLQSTNPNAMFQQGLAPSGLNSYVYPAQTILTPVSGNLAGAPNSSLLYSPFVTPYTLVNPYQPVVQVGQPTTFYLPQTNMPGQQKLVYLVPPSTTAPTMSPPHIPSSSSAQLNVALQSPSSMHTTLSRKTSDSAITEEDRQRFKRRQSIPNNLSSLLVSPLEQLGPESPPSAKRMRLSEGNPPSNSMHAHNPRHPQSPEQQLKLSSIQHHLLQVHRTSHQRYSEGGSLPNSASHSPMQSPQSRGQSPGFSPTRVHLSRNGYESDESDFDETEAEKIVGGAVVSPDQQTDYGVPAPHSQLQLWQFLLELLLISANTHLIQWTNNNFEFQINKPSDVARLWGKVTNNNTMDYHKLSQGLHYYFHKGIMSKVKGKHLCFRYNGSIQNYIEMRRSNIASQEEVVVVE